MPRDSGMETTGIHSEERTVVQDDGQGKGAGPLTRGYDIIITHFGMVILCGLLGSMEKCLEDSKWSCPEGVSREDEIKSSLS